MLCKCWPDRNCSASESESRSTSFAGAALRGPAHVPFPTPGLHGVPGMEQVPLRSGWWQWIDHWSWSLLHLPICVVEQGSHGKGICGHHQHVPLWLHFLFSRLFLELLLGLILNRRNCSRSTACCILAGRCSSGAGLKGSCVLNVSHACPPLLQPHGSCPCGGGPVPDSICDLAPEGPDHRVDRPARSSRDLARSQACKTTVLFKRIVWDATSLRTPLPEPSSHGRGSPCWSGTTAQSGS